MADPVLRIATCQFAETWAPARNGAVIRRYLQTARDRGADVVHFHEGALSGYGGAISDAAYPWDELKRQTQRITDDAQRLGLWVVLGSAHPLTPPNRPHNSLYLISPDGRIVDRYDKRFCTDGDLAHYSPGDHFVTFRLKGLTCSLLICYDVRFPELYRELARLGVRVVFHSFHNARSSCPQLHRPIMRPTLQAHAGMNGLWISAPNSSARVSAWPSVFVTPDGRIAGQLRLNRPGLMVNPVDPSADYYDATRTTRPAALAGQLHHGELVRDPRSADRTGL